MDLEALQALSLKIAQERSVDNALKLIVKGLAEQSGIALARLWLIESNKDCLRCPMKQACSQETTCLHLMASAGNPTKVPPESWNRIDGDFCRFPMRSRKIGHIGATGEAILLQDISHNEKWIAQPQWALKEGICSFAGQPLIFRDKVLGVLAIFSHERLTQREFSWLRMFADHAAVVIANSCAFAEIERLREQLSLENHYLREEVKAELAFGDIVGQSPALKKVLQQIELVAPTEANVLILGESGTGKELIARAIHERSQRMNAPIVKVNCASIPRELFESEFFGHIRGSFTGAVRDRVGRFQLANKGTLFLDEVGEIPLDLQSKMLRVLQEGQFERVGDDRTQKTDVRIIAATNRNLLQEVEAGTFRRDLYYRLSVFPLEAPPLRDRREDIPLLALHFIQLASVKNKCAKLKLTTEEIEWLKAYHWPGNVRELQNVIERAMILSSCGSVDFREMLPIQSMRRTSPTPFIEPQGETTPQVLPQAEIEQLERANIIAALKVTKGKVYGKGGAAELLGIKATTLASKLKVMQIDQKT